MSVQLNNIQAPISNEMEVFEEKFKSYMKSQFFLLDKIMTYIVKRKGKQLRPMFVLFMAKLSGEINEKTYRGASLIELLHTATLVHDDVVDDANYRRGFFSVNALWKNKIAVLIGDYLLSRGLLLSVDNEDFELLKIVSNAVKEMSEGELLQIEKARLLNIKEADYFTIIRQKTASLMASCCAVGTASITSDKDLIEKSRLIGEKAGIAFQIKDDLFDYSDGEIGKPVGIDIKEKKMTLPLIYAINKSSFWERNKIVNIVKNESDKPAKVKYVIDFVKKSGGIEYAVDIMNSYKNESIALIHSYPPSATRDSLEQLIRFTVEREK
ncbi:MAG: polyprenyl synthetase family protein [Bacteroidota bacterium]|nr:polyprenyl synthetase family protein [Bacteroidota bacterium]